MNRNEDFEIEFCFHSMPYDDCEDGCGKPFVPPPCIEDEVLPEEDDEEERELTEIEKSFLEMENFMRELF